jgi:F-type H+-transporting ATPase subunit a
LRTIFPRAPGLSGAGALAMSIAMGPIEILGKFVKPFALAVRLFGNMTAGHFVILSLFGLIFLFGHLEVWNWGIGFVTSGLVLGIMLLELFVAFLQAYVFALLTSVFIGLMQHEH